MTQKDKFIQYVLSYPSIHSLGGQQTLIYSAGLDMSLQNQIQFNMNAQIFAVLLHTTLASWGLMEGNRNPFAEIIKAIMQYVGQDKRKQGEELLAELGEDRLTILFEEEARFEQQPLSIEQKIDHIIAMQEVLEQKIDRILRSYKEQL